MNEPKVYFSKTEVELLVLEASNLIVKLEAEGRESLVEELFQKYRERNFLQSWICGVITEEELRNVILAHLQTRLWKIVDEEVPTEEIMKLELVVAEIIENHRYQVVAVNKGYR